jgi:MFS family permease
LYSQLGVAGLSLTLLVMGITTGGFISTLWGIVQDVMPSEILGLISGMLNPAPFFGVAAFQVLTGAALDRTSRIGDLYPLSGFRNAFLICLFAIIICLVLSFFLARFKEPEAS